MNRQLVKLGLAFVCSLLLTLVSPTQAMTFSESLLNEDVLIIKLQGSIVKGDMARMRNLVGRANHEKKRKAVVLIDSPGEVAPE
jgi:membrane-bound ClpP family serine protease